MKIKNFKRIYVDIVISCLIIAVVATFFAFKSQTISQEQVLNTLSEISSQSVNVIDKEIQKNVAVLANLSIYISQAKEKKKIFCLQTYIFYEVVRMDKIWFEQMFAASFFGF